MDITAYTSKLKQLADALHDISQLVRETSQVLINMLRGLSSKYRHTVPVITAKNPPHTFLSARSYLLLEEQYDKEQAKAAHNQALLATAGGCSTLTPPGEGGTSSAAEPAPLATAPRSDHAPKKKGRGRGQPGGSTSNPAARPPGGSWAPGLNPWTVMVQAWPMPFRVPGAGVLGPRPGTQPQQAYFAGAVPPMRLIHGVTPSIQPDVWNHQALLATLMNSGVPPSGPQASEWFLDIGASSHMSSNAGSFSHPIPLSRPTSITVGNGATMPVTHRAVTTLATDHSPLVSTTFLFLHLS
ncbi:uncharacterized protein [Miscanthus floridulus]|uniref:uncharacterized protein n=1 Tax=Miscanthus floridulus TaxID=154761 RepID=UPI003458FDD0